MATQTPNLNLTKPMGTDYVRIGDFNDNADKLDVSIGDLGQLTTDAKASLVLAINEANASSSFPPYIGENLHWYVWNAGLAQYEDSGIMAEGQDGENGTDGVNAYAHFKWSAAEPDDDADMKDTPDAWIGVYSGTSATPPAAYTSYAWYRYKGATGDTGESGTGNNWYVGTAISGTSLTPAVYPTGIPNTLIGDMYLNNGELPDTGRAYVCTLGGNAATALWKYSCLLRGADGSGTGDMLKSTYDSDSDGIVDDSEMLGGNLPAWYQQSTNGLTAETSLADADALPFYDASASAGRKTTWGNLKSVLKTYFDTLYTAALLLLTGYTKPAQSAAIAATDSICTAIGKLERGLDDKAASIHASRHSEGGADAISPADIGAAVPATDLTANLAAASWEGASAPYTQTVSGLSGVTSDSKLDIGLAETATDAQFTEAVTAQIRATGSGTGTVTFKAHGTKPTSALPILIRMVD